MGPFGVKDERRTIPLTHQDLALRAFRLKPEARLSCSHSTCPISPHAHGHYHHQLSTGSSSVRQVLCGRAWPQGTITSLCSPHQQSLLFLHFSLQLLPRLKVSEMSTFLDVCCFTVFLHQYSQIICHSPYLCSFPHRSPSTLPFCW